MARFARPSPQHSPFRQSVFGAPAPRFFFISLSNNAMKRSTTILAIDPGLRELGFAVLAGQRLVASGVGPLRLHPEAERPAEARRLVYGWIRSYRPEILVLEA